MPALSMIKRSLLRFEFAELPAKWLSLGITLPDYLIIGIGTAVIIAVELYQEIKKRPFRAWLEECPDFIQWLFVFVPMVLLLFFGILRADYIATEFIYKAF